MHEHFLLCSNMIIANVLFLYLTVGKTKQKTKKKPQQLYRSSGG